MVARQVGEANARRIRVESLERRQTDRMYYSRSTSKEQVKSLRNAAFPRIQQLLGGFTLLPRTMLLYNGGTRLERFREILRRRLFN